MRAPRPAPAPYTPKRALNSGSSAGAAAALGIQKLAGKNDLFAFSSAFLTGYLAGIPLGRFELHGAFTSLTEHVMAAQSYTAFWSVWCSWFAAAFLQASLIYLCGFHLWGSIFMGAYFAFKGTVLGVCASAIYASGGARALVVYWLLNCLPELVQLYVFRFSRPLRQCPALNPSSLWTAVQYSQYPQGERLPPPVSTAAG